jgi:CRISPR-associated protein Csm1
MSAQVLLQGKLLGIEDFLLAAPAEGDDSVFQARSMWVALLGEVLPRALLADAQLPPMMLGSSGGGELVIILPDSTRAEAAHGFLLRTAEKIEKIGHGTLKLVWSATENLGDWTIVRKRLQDGMRSRDQIEISSPGFFQPFSAIEQENNVIPGDLRQASSVGWSFDFAALMSAHGGDYRWDLGHQASPNNISITRHAAHAGNEPANLDEVARRSKGQRRWGVLRGEIDDFGTRMRRLQSVEEHVHLSMLYKQFLTGEIELLCSQGDYFQRITVLHSGNSDFAVYGAWDALASFARELERVFARFTEENLKDLPGGEAKTVTMALTIAEPGNSLARRYENCGRDLAIAKSTDKDCLYMMGRVLEWKQLQDAAELRDAILRLNEEFRGGKQFLGQLRGLYKKVEAPERTDEDRLMARAARFQRRFARMASRREREFQKLRSHLMKEMSGRNLSGRLRLRPEGLVALEWARLSQE